MAVDDDDDDYRHHYVDDDVDSSVVVVTASIRHDDHAGRGTTSTTTTPSDGCPAAKQPAPSSDDDCDDDGDTIHFVIGEPRLPPPRRRVKHETTDDEDSLVDGDDEARQYSSSEDDLGDDGRRQLTTSGGPLSSRKGCEAVHRMAPLLCSFSSSATKMADGFRGIDEEEEVVGSRLRQHVLCSGGGNGFDVASSRGDHHPDVVDDDDSPPGGRSSSSSNSTTSSSSFVSWCERHIAVMPTTLLMDDNDDTPGGGGIISPRYYLAVPSSSSTADGDDESSSFDSPSEPPRVVEGGSGSGAGRGDDDRRRCDEDYDYSGHVDDAGEGVTLYLQTSSLTSRRIDDELLHQEEEEDAKRRTDRRGGLGSSAVEKLLSWTESASPFHFEAVRGRRGRGRGRGGHVAAEGGGREENDDRHVRFPAVTSSKLSGEGGMHRTLSYRTSLVVPVPTAEGAEGSMCPVRFSEKAEVSCDVGRTASASPSSEKVPLGEMIVIQPLTEGVYVDVDDPTPADPSTFGCSVVNIDRDTTEIAHDDDDDDVDAARAGIIMSYGNMSCRVELLPPSSRVIDVERPSFESPQNVIAYRITIYRIHSPSDDGDSTNASCPDPPSMLTPPGQHAPLALRVDFDTTVHFRYPSPVRRATGGDDDDSSSSTLLQPGGSMWTPSLPSWFRWKDIFSLDRAGRSVDVTIPPPVTYRGRWNGWDDTGRRLSSSSSTALYDPNFFLRPDVTGRRPYDGTAAAGSSFEAMARRTWIEVVMPPPSATGSNIKTTTAAGAESDLVVVVTTTLLITVLGSVAMMRGMLGVSRWD